MDSTDKQDNLRNTGRRRTLFGGRLADTNGNEWECSIGDISATGARVQTDASLTIDSHVELKINKYNSFHGAYVIWVREGELGLQFINEIDANDEDMRRLFKLTQK